MGTPATTISTTSSIAPTTTTTVAMSGSTTSTSPTHPPSPYTVVAGDYSYAIAEKLGCVFDNLAAANPGVDWDTLAIGQVLNGTGDISDISISSK